MTAARLLLTRHGETVWHADNRYAGPDSDVDLTEFGQVQAAALGHWARDRRIDAVLSSPVRRAIETARPAADALGLSVEVVDDLREVDFGVATGRTLSELDTEMVHRFRADPVRNPFPDAESPRLAAERAAAALRGIADRHNGCSVLVVAHNTLLRLGICVLLDLPVSDYRRLFPRLDTAAITELRVSPDPAVPASLLSLNVPVVTARRSHDE